MFLKRGMRLGLGVGPRKNTSAAKKMVSLAAGVSIGRSREVRLWGMLVSLSLVMYQPINAYQRNSASSAAQSHDNECGECPRIDTSTHSVLANSTYKESDDYFNLSGTRYVKCKLNGKSVCYDLKARYQKVHSETSAHNIQKRNINQAPLPTCKQCNRTVQAGGKRKSVFVAYFQVNQLCYDHTQLEMCVMEGKTYWVGKNLRYENGLISDSEPVIIDLLEENYIQICA